MATFQNILSDDQIRRLAPSVFAEAAHESRSDRYAYIPTSAVLAGMRSEGFLPTYAGQSRSRIPGKAAFTKHLLRFRHERDQAADHGTFNELVLVNSHDGTSSYKLMAGVFRIVCANGMITGNIIEEQKIHHKGDVRDRVIEGAYKIVEQMPLVDESRRAMQALTLTGPQQEAFAEAALMVRYPDEEKPAPIEARRLLARRRWSDDDKDTSLWTTFNRVQENVIRGGLHGRNVNNRRTSTREVKGIDQNVALNRALWTLAERMRELV